MSGVKSTYLLPALGSPVQAKMVLQRATQEISAFQQFLAKNTCSELKQIADYPWTDKGNYLSCFEYSELLGGDRDETFTIFASSGSSGSSFYWPQLRSQHRGHVPRLQDFLEASFQVNQKKTLSIVGLALGSWIGGEHMSWALKSMALNTSYPFAVFSPGNNHDEILHMIAKAESFVDQFLLFLCPSAIAHIKLRAESRGQQLPMDKIRFMVLGEPFPEAVRIGLQKQAGLAETENIMFSIYGSADTGTLGVESAASVALRRLLADHPELADELGIERALPHFFHCIAPDAYLEVDHDELLITRWQGIPLLRYNLHDRVHLCSWSALCQAVFETVERRNVQSALLSVLSAAGDQLPDLLVVSGRADSVLILCGTNLTEAMLDEAIRSPALASYLTGSYSAGIVYEAERQRLALTLEFRQDSPCDQTRIDQVYELLVQELGRVQPEFLDDWKSVYNVWDTDPARRILALDCCPWPALSGSSKQSIKQRGIKP